MANRRAKSRITVYDELINHLEGLYFQIPVMSFIDRHCAIFDPHQQEETEYRKVWAAYKSLITQLLECFREDNDLNHEQIISALAEMDKVSDIHDLYQGLFAQVFATESFEIFKNMMTQKNIELQQQVQSPVPGGRGSAQNAPTEGSTSEEAILAAVIRQSQVEHEAAERRRSQKDGEMMARALIVSKQEAQRLQQEHMEQEMILSRAVQEIAFSDQTQVGALRQSPKKSPLGSPAKGSPMKAPPPQQSPVKKFSLGAEASHVSGEQAASAWLTSALKDAEQDPMLKRFAQGSGDLSPEEMKKRQDFLKQQRDKLIQMKAKEREKQLKNAEKANPGRPSSARAARAALKDDGKAKQIDEKTLAMRRAIADKLKAEVIVEKP